MEVQREGRGKKRKNEKSTIGGETGGGRSGSRGTRWIQIIKFDWADLGRGVPPAVCVSDIY